MESTASLPCLPPELWTLILSNLETPSHINSASQVSKTWHTLTNAHHFEPVWRRIWDTTASLSSAALLTSPFLRVPGSWRQQVAASYRLERLHKAPILFLPPRYLTHSHVHPADHVAVTPSTSDLEDALGRAVHAHAFAQAVLVAFERGLGLLRQRPPHNRTRKPKTPSLFYDDAPTLHAVQMLAPVCAQSGTVLAVTHDNLIRIDIQSNPHQPFVWRVLDTFHDVGTPLQLTPSTDSRHGAIGFSTGSVRIVSLSGGCRSSFHLPEEAANLAVSEDWAIAANSFQPIAMSVWDLTARSLHATFTQASEDWGKVHVIAGIAPTSIKDQFIVWDGHTIVRFFNARTRRFVRTYNFRIRFIRQPRCATEEAEYGAGSPHLGRGKMVLSADRETVALATSNRVAIISVRQSRTYRQPHQQLDQAKRAVLAMSTDDRLVLTAEGNAYGTLHTRVCGRQAIDVKPKLQVWDVKSESLRCELSLPCPATALSVCGDTVAVVCGAVGQVMVAFANPAPKNLTFH